MTKQNASQIFDRRYEASQAETAAYISDFLQELERIAVRQQLEPLDRLLKIARDEALKISLSA